MTLEILAMAFVIGVLIGAVGGITCYVLFNGDK